MVVRSLAILMLSWLTDVTWVLEAPTGSTINYVGAFSRLLEFVGFPMHHVAWLGFFGADSSKPVKLYSSHPWIRRVRSKRCDHAVKLCRTRVVRGKAKVSGKSSLLRMSERYPRAFAKAVFGAYCIICDPERTGPSI